MKKNKKDSQAAYVSCSINPAPFCPYAPVRFWTNPPPPPSTYLHTLWMAPCDYIKNKYDKSKLYFTDTDSLMYEIKDEGVYEGFSSNKEMFDFSNDSTKWKYYDNSNKLVIGRMKDETGGVAIEEFVGLKSKMYSFLVENNKEKKAK